MAGIYYIYSNATYDTTDWVKVAESGLIPIFMDTGIYRQPPSTYTEFVISNKTGSFPHPLPGPIGPLDPWWPFPW
jgi:hypothetical protein